MALNIFTRDFWHAIPPSLETPVASPVHHVLWMNIKFETCETKAQCTDILLKAQKYNIKAMNLRDIRHNFMVGGDGNVYEGRGWECETLPPERFASHRKDSLIIGFLGLFTVKDLPAAMKLAADNIIQYGINNGYIDEDYELHDLLVVLPKRSGGPY